MKKLVLLALVSIVPVQLSWGVGTGSFANATYSAKSIGMGFTGVALADDPSAAYFNPAGALQLDRAAIQLGFSPVSLDTEFSGAAGNSNMDDGYVLPAYFYTVLPFKERFSFTFGINSPYGLATEWSNTSPQRYNATKSELINIQINPSLAYKVNDRFSVAGGVVYGLTNADLQKNIFIAANPDGYSKMEGDGDAWGYNLSMLFAPKDDHQFGMSYRSPLRTTIEGTTEVTNLSGPYAALAGASSFEANTETSLHIPSSFMIGYAYSPNKWTFELDGEYVGFGSLDEINLTNSGPNLGGNALLDGDNALNKNKDWRNTWNFGFGTGYQLNERWQLRTGLVHYEQVIPDHTFNPAIPDSARTGITLGTGYTRPSFSIDFAYNRSWGKSRNITTAENSNMVLSAGEYSTIINDFSLAYTQRFGGEK